MPMLKITAPILLLASLMSGCVSLPVSEDFEIGVTKAVLRERFGEPAETQEMVKRTEFVFGPVETFWSSMEMEDQLEIWSYRSPGGHVELYFTNGSDAVSGKGFNDENAVY